MPNFTKKNDAFICEHCQRHVPQAEKTCRNHCPYCLHSKHVDILPGDRQNTCQGLLKPIAYENTGHKGLVLIFECTVCKERTRNIANLQDKFQSDDYQAILALPGKH